MDPMLHPRLLKVWSDPRPAFIDEGVLRCPYCPDEENGALHAKLGKMIVWPDFDDYDSPAGTRGEFILIPMICEFCSQYSALTIANHKGTMILNQLVEAKSAMYNDGSVQTSSLDK